MSKDREKVGRIINYILAGLTVTPQIVEQVGRLIELKRRFDAGEDVSLTDVDVVLADMDARSGRIQSA